MSIRTLAAIAAGGLVMTLAGGPLSPLYAQESTSVDADADIVREVTTRNLLELRLADMARKKSTNAAVKDFAERMRTDHLAMNEQLNALVGQDGKPFRTGLGKMQPQVDEVRRLEKMSGNQFDLEYMSSMIWHHQENVNYFQSNANTARSAQVRTLLTNGLPVLQQHLSLATQVGSQVGVRQTVAAGGQNPTPNPQSPTPPTQNQPPTQNPLPPTQNQPVVPGASQSTPAQRDAFKKDNKFVREAVQDNTLEIRLAQVAQQKATNSNIRQLAQRLQNDHMAMQGRWLSLAASNDTKLKTNLGPRHTKKAERLEKMSGSNFDRAYVTMLIQNNQDYLEYFEKEGRATRSDQVRNLAANDAPIIRQHLAAAKQLGSQVGVDTTAALQARKHSAYKN
jgi:putative membrane protein